MGASDRVSNALSLASDPVKYAASTLQRSAISIRRIHFVVDNESEIESDGWLHNSR